MSSSNTPVVLITGANKGLGFSLAQRLSESKKAYTILVGARNSARGEEAVAKLKTTKTNDETIITTLKIDLGSHKSIVAAVEDVSERYGRLDILVNNAAIADNNGSEASREDWQAIFNINVMGTVDATHSFLPLLNKSSDPKIVVISSSMGSIKIAETFKYPGTVNAMPYRVTKAAMNMVIVEWSNHLDGVKVWGVDPGLCATDFAGDFSRQHGRDPKEGADIARQCIEGEREDAVGKLVFQEGGETGVRPW